MKKIIALAMFGIALLFPLSAASAAVAHHPRTPAKPKVQQVKAHTKQSAVKSKKIIAKPVMTKSKQSKTQKTARTQKSRKVIKDLSKEGLNHSKRHLRQHSNAPMHVTNIHPNVTLPDLPADDRHPLPKDMHPKKASPSIVEPKRNIFQSVWHALTTENTPTTPVAKKVSMTMPSHWATHFGNHDSQDCGVGSPLCVPFESNMGIRTSNVYGVAVPIKVLMDRYDIKDFKWSSWQKVREAGVIATNSSGKSLPIAPIVDLGPGKKALRMGHDIDLTKPASDIFGGDGPCTYTIVDGAFKDKHPQFEYAYHPLISRTKLFARTQIGRKHSTMLASTNVGRYYRH